MITCMHCKKPIDLVESQQPFYWVHTETKKTPCSDDDTNLAYPADQPEPAAPQGKEQTIAAIKAPYGIPYHEWIAGQISNQCITEDDEGSLLFNGLKCEQLVMRGMVAAYDAGQDSVELKLKRADAEIAQLWKELDADRKERGKLFESRRETEATDRLGLVYVDNRLLHMVCSEAVPAEPIPDAGQKTDNPVRKAAIPCKHEIFKEGQ